MGGLGILEAILALTWSPFRLQDGVVGLLGCGAIYCYWACILGVHSAFLYGVQNVYVSLSLHLDARSSWSAMMLRSNTLVMLFMSHAMIIMHLFLNLGTVPLRDRRTRRQCP
jgi:hypothetical protein